MLLVQLLHQRQRIKARQRHHTQAQRTHQVATAGGGFGLQTVIGRQHRACPGQHALAGGGEPFEALAAIDQRQVQLFFKVAQAHRKGWLGDVATRRGLAEVTGLVEGDEEFQLLDVHLRSRAYSNGGGILARLRLWLGWNPSLPDWSSLGHLEINYQGERTMSIFSFIKEAGEKIVDLLTPGNANASEQLKEHVAKVGLGNPNVQTTVDGDKVTVTGEVATQEEKEKILLALGNIQGVASVDDQITVTGPAVAAARFVVVKKGDTLSAISLTVYGNANLYNKIFEANKPLLSHPDKIYPGQTLRIPE